MKSARGSIRTAMLSAAIAVPFLMAVTMPADAGERTRKVVRTGSNGQQLESVRTRSLQDGHYESHASSTGTDGKTASRDTVADYDAETGTLTRDTTTVGPNGKTAHTQATVQKTDSGYTRDASHVGPNGQQSSSHSEVVRTEDGFERSKTTTGPNGKTATSQASVSRTENGYVRDSTATGPNGKTVTQHTEASYDAATNTASKVRTTTHPNGETTTKEVTRTFTPTP